MNAETISDALARAIDAAGLPAAVITPGTESCLLPQLIELSRALALDSEQEIIQDLGMHSGEYGQGFDDGLRYAAHTLLKLYNVEE